MASSSSTGPTSHDDESHPRLEGLADLVFGLALSIGAVFLIGSPPNTPTQLAGDVAEFGFSFLVLITVWLRYTQTMSVMRLEARWAIQLNIVLLFLVAIEPFLFNVAFTRATQSSASGFANLVTAVYAVNLGGLNACLAALTAVASGQLRAQGRGKPSIRFRQQSGYLGLASAFFFFSALPWFYDWPILGGELNVRFLLWLVPLGVARFWRRLA